jgi:hypothetical protein
MKAIKETLIRCSGTPIYVTEALEISAINENIYLDCAYFLLQREPHVLQKLLLSTPGGSSSGGRLVPGGSMC